MKSQINNIFIMMVLSLLFFSCEKDQEMVVVVPAETPTLSASAESAELSEEKEEEEVLTLTWTPADYGYSAAVEYTLQVDVEGGDFSDPVNIDMGNNFEKVFSVEELNSTALGVDLAPDEEGQLIFRIVSAVNPLVEALASEPVAVTVTPYSTIIEPAFIYVPGAYQGWDPASAESLISVEDNGIYVGYITFPDAESLKFKFTPEKNWSTDYGQGDAEGTLKVKGADLSVSEPGTYQITVDLNELTWSAEPYSWGVVGDATGSWDVDKDMTYDSGERVWKLTTDLTVGSIKFRLNDDWGVNYGDDDPNNEQLDFNSPNNIPIAEAGTYEIILNLQDPENPVYSLTKQ